MGNPSTRVVVACLGLMAVAACSSSSKDTSPSNAAATQQEITDAIQGHPSVRVQAANDALVAGLTPDELDHIRQIDWGKATSDGLLADDVFLKAVEAVLPVLDAPTSSTPAPLSVLSIAPADVHPSDRGVCTPNCSECRRYLENAVEVLQKAIVETVDRGKSCANPFCAAAAIVRCAQLTGYLAFATGCLLTANFTAGQSRSVVAMVSSCSNVCPKTKCAPCNGGKLECVNGASLPDTPAANVCSGACKCTGGCFTLDCGATFPFPPTKYCAQP